MYSIDFSQVPKALDGSTLRDDKSNVYTLSALILVALFNFDPEANGDTKATYYAIGEKIFNRAMVEVTEGEVVVMKQAVGKFFAPNIVGPVFKLLNVKAN